MSKANTQRGARERLLDAAMRMIRERGYTATTVDELCAAAGVTKGSFFHHFESKEDLAVAAAGHFASMAAGLFASAPYQKLEDPLDRVMGYIDFREEILAGEVCDYTCLLGTMVQETYGTHPAIREACERHMGEHIAEVARDIAAAKKKYAPRAKWSPESLARFTQAALQGGFILAKAGGGAGAAAESVRHLRRYVEDQFGAKAGGSTTGRT